MKPADEVEPEVDPTEVPTTTRSLRRRILQGLLSFALAGAVLVFVLPQIADLSEVWNAIQDMTTLEIAVLVVVAIWNLATYWILIVICDARARRTRRPSSSRSRRPRSRTPCPPAARCRSGSPTGCSARGASPSPASRCPSSCPGIWNNFAKLAMPIVAVSLLALEGGAGGGRILSALIGLRRARHRDRDLRPDPAQRGVRGAHRQPDRADRVTRLRRIFRKGPVEGYDLAVVKFRSRVIGLVRHRWLAADASGRSSSHLSLYAVLLTALRQIGVSDDEVSWTQVLAVFAFARLLTAIPLTPGGLGVIELALIGGPRRGRRARTRRSSARCCCSGSSPTSSRSRSG